MVGLEVRTEAAAGGVGGGGVVAGWDLSAEAGPGPGLGGGRSSDPGSVRRQRREKERVSGRRYPAGPRGPPASRSASGGLGDQGSRRLTPRSHGNTPPRPTGRRGEADGERVSAASSSHKRQKAPGWDNGAASLCSDQGALQRGTPGRGDCNTRDSIPVRPLPRGNFLFWGAGMDRAGGSGMEVSVQGTGRT